MMQYVIGGISFATLLGSIIGVYVKLTNDITILKEKQAAQCKELDTARTELRLHEQINERTFEKIFQSIDSMNGKLDKLIGFLEGNGILKQK